MKASIRFCTVSTPNRPLPQLRLLTNRRRFIASALIRLVTRLQNVSNLWRTLNQFSVATSLVTIDSLIVPVVCLPECLFVQFCNRNALFSSNFIKCCNWVLGSLTPIPVICRHVHIGLLSISFRPIVPTVVCSSSIACCVLASTPEAEPGFSCRSTMWS